MKQIGKIGRRNINANKKLKELYLQKGITECELKFDGCYKDNFLSFAHRNKRVYYRDKPELLSDFNETLLACVPCHMIIEKNKELSEFVFKRLRK